MKVKNSTYIYRETTTNKNLVENFLELSHRTLFKLNTEDINRPHFNNVAQKMIKINTIGEFPKREKIC